MSATPGHNPTLGGDATELTAAAIAADTNALDVALSTRASQATQLAIGILAATIETELAAIKVKTDQLTFLGGELKVAPSGAGGAGDGAILDGTIPTQKASVSAAGELSVIVTAMPAGGAGLTDAELRAADVPVRGMHATASGSISTAGTAVAVAAIGAVLLKVVVTENSMVSGDVFIEGSLDGVSWTQLTEVFTGSGFSLNQTHVVGTEKSYLVAGSIAVRASTTFGLTGGTMGVALYVTGDALHPDLATNRKIDELIDSIGFGTTISGDIADLTTAVTHVAGTEVPGGSALTIQGHSAGVLVGVESLLDDLVTPTGVDAGGGLGVQGTVGGVPIAVTDAQLDSALNLAGTEVFSGIGLTVQGNSAGVPVPVSGPATDAQLRATPLPVSGTVATGGLTDTQLRATAVPVSLPVADTTTTGALVAPSTSVIVPCAGKATVVVNFSGVWTGNLFFAASVDGGVTYPIVVWARPISGVTNPLLTSFFDNTNGLASTWAIPVTGYTHLKIATNAGAVTGSIAVRAVASSTPFDVGMALAMRLYGPTGTPVNVTGNGTNLGALHVTLRDTNDTNDGSTANQGSPQATVVNSWPMKISDGATSGFAKVTPASTAPLAADQALVAALSPNGNQLTDAQLRATPVSVDARRALTPLSVAIDVAAAGDNALVAADATKKIKVLGYVMVADAAVAARFKSAATSKSGAMSFAANGGAVAPYIPPNAGHWFETAVNEALNLNLSAAIGVRGHLAYVLEA